MQRLTIRYAMLLALEPVGSPRTIRYLVREVGKRFDLGPHPSKFLFPTFFGSRFGVGAFAESDGAATNLIDFHERPVNEPSPANAIRIDTTLGLERRHPMQR